MNIWECSLSLFGMCFGIFVFIYNMNRIYDIIQDHADVYRGVKFFMFYYIKR